MKLPTSSSKGYVPRFRNMLITNIADMKTEQILKTIRTWEKKSGFSVSPKVRKTAPSWIARKVGRSSHGVSLNIEGFEPMHAEAVSCPVWIDEDKKKVFYDFNFEIQYRRTEIQEFGTLKDLRRILEYLECYRFSVIQEVVYKWLESRGYVTDEEQCCIDDYTRTPYGLPNDPCVENWEFPMLIGYDEKNNFRIERAMGRGHTLNISNGKFTTRKELREWLDKYAIPTNYDDCVIKCLDERRAKIALSKLGILVYGNITIFLYELEEASDKAIDILCRHRGAIALSEKSFLTLSDKQLKKLIDFTAPKKGQRFPNSLEIHIGALAEGTIDEKLCRKMARIPVSKHGNGYYELNESVVFLSDKCTEILSRSTSEIKTWAVECPNNKI